MQFVARNRKIGGENHQWLGSAHATNHAQSITIDGTKLASFKGSIPSGVPLKKGESGKYEPVAEAGDTLAGFLLTTQQLDGVGDVIAPMIDHGRVRVDRLPAGAFDVKNLTAKPDRFVFIEEA